MFLENLYHKRELNHKAHVVKFCVVWCKNPMPVVFVSYVGCNGAGAVIKNRPARLVKLIIPRLTTTAKKWAWDEVKTAQSQIDGFGVYPKPSQSLNWLNLQRIPVMLPYLGQECETDSAFASRLFVSVLFGNFVVMKLADVAKPDEAAWYLNGVCLVCATEDDFIQEPNNYNKAMTPLAKFLHANAATYRSDCGNPEVLQIYTKTTRTVNEPTTVNVGDNSVAYVLKRDVMSLLRIPEHLFQVLEMHHHHHHTDRHLATHLLKFCRSQKSHILSNAHHCFQNPAFIMGCVNEPQSKAPNFKIAIGRVKVLHNQDPLMLKHGVKQCAKALKHWNEFVAEFPDAMKTNPYYLSTQNSYLYHQEITVSYGSAYIREYNCGTINGTPDSIPKDVFTEAVKKKARWPDRVPGWFNPDMQPINRPAFQMTKGAIDVVPDLPDIVQHRQTTLEPRKGTKRKMPHGSASKSALQHDADLASNEVEGNGGGFYEI